MLLKRIARKFLNGVSFLKYSHKIGNSLKNTKGRKTVIWGSPSHTNLGDQAQTFCIEKWVRKYLEGYTPITIYQINSPKQRARLLKILKKYVTDIDLIICHSGYHFCEMYPLHKQYEDLMQQFPDNKIVVFPQTINFEKESEIIKSAEILNAHKDCTLLCRDAISYKTAQNFYKCKLYLYPDIVTSLIGNYKYPNEKREGILFCLRNDKEALYDRNVLNDFMQSLDGYRCDVTDTNAPEKLKLVVENRQKILEKKFEQFSKYRIVVTDRYHGTIFSLIAGTPVIVISSTDHKLSSGVDWFALPEFKNFIFFAKDLNEVKTIIADRYNNFPANQLPPYFENSYYGKLKQLLFPAN